MRLAYFQSMSAEKRRMREGWLLVASGLLGFLILGIVIGMVLHD